MRPTSTHSRPHRESLDLKKLGVQEMDAREMVEVEGGFILLVIFGVAFSAKAVAGGAGAVFLASMGIGAAVAASN